LVEIEVGDAVMRHRRGCGDEDDDSADPLQHGPPLESFFDSAVRFDGSATLNQICSPSDIPTCGAGPCMDLYRRPLRLSACPRRRRRTVQNESCTSPCKRWFGIERRTKSEPAMSTQVSLKPIHSRGNSLKNATDHLHTDLSESIAALD